jgi:hypothetical protein
MLGKTAHFPGKKMREYAGMSALDLWELGEFLLRISPKSRILLPVPARQALQEFSHANTNNPACRILG